MVVGLDEAKSIGLIFDAGSAAEYRLVMAFVKMLNDMGKQVHSLGFIPQKKQPGYLYEQDNWLYCQKHDFAWNLRLKKESLQAYVDNEFDLLIDVSPTSAFFAKYLSGLSSARYKVGRYNAEQLDLFDLMMQVPDNTEIQELMDHIIHYLKIIKKPIPNAK